MIDNTGLLKSLITQRTIRICDAEWLHRTPAPLPPDFDFGKIEGMLLGVAVGDALGAPTEGKLSAERHKQFGEISDYIASEHSGNKAVGVPTDDTQLTYWTLKQLIVDNGLIPNNLAKQFCEHPIRGIGGTTTGFLSNYRDSHKPWYNAGLDSRSNGALMRISPVIIPYLKTPHPSIYADAALATMITHNSFANTATSVAFANILWLLLSMKSPPEPRWWVDTYCSVAEKLEGNSRYSIGTPGYESSLWEFTHEVVTDALNRRLTVLQACNEWGSKWSLFETVPSVLYILARHAQNAEEAIIRAVNDTQDNDSIAAIVGAAVGALHGVKHIPDRWIKGLTGRTRNSDDGELFKLILLAKKAFWS